MATGDDDPQSPAPIPRPMIVRVLAALAVVGIVVLSMWYIIRAAHDVNKRVKESQTNVTLTLTATHALSSTRVHADAGVLQRRAQALGYTARATNVGATVTLGTNRAISAADRHILLTTGTVDNRVELTQLPVGKKTHFASTSGAGQTCAQLVDNWQWFWDVPPHRTCYLLGQSLLSGDAVTFAHATNDPQENGWGVDATYRDNEFVDKVAKPYVGKQIAILFGGEVVTDPVIEQGITGSNVRISGRFTETSARTLAAVLASGDLTDQFALK